MMKSRFTETHQNYCRIDLHARSDQFLKAIQLQVQPPQLQIEYTCKTNPTQIRQ